MSLDRLTFAVAIFVVAGALCAGCGKDSASVAVAHLTVHQAVVQHTSRVVTNYLSSIAHSD